MDQYLVTYDQGPARTVGPFPTREAASEWAERYQREYRAMQGPMPLEWRITALVSPASLEWW